jgi:hypothetical protein
MERLPAGALEEESHLARKTHAAHLHRLRESRGKGSIDIIKGHVALLQSHIGDLEPRQSRASSPLR